MLPENTFTFFLRGGVQQSSITPLPDPWLASGLTWRPSDELERTGFQFIDIKVLPLLPIFFLAKQTNYWMKCVAVRKNWKCNFSDQNKGMTGEAFSCADNSVIHRKYISDAVQEVKVFNCKFLQYIILLKNSLHNLKIPTYTHLQSLNCAFINYAKKSKMLKNIDFAIHREKLKAFWYLR